MEFQRILSLLIAAFEADEIRYALIGGFALVVHGVMRTTVDLDFLVHRDDLDRLDSIMSRIGYKLAFRTDDVSQFVAPTPDLGEVDFLHAFRDYSKEILASAQTMDLAGLKLQVARPEDLIGLKVQAMANDQMRRSRELADIESLLERYQGRVDWQRIKAYFELFDFRDDFKRVKEVYGPAH